MHDLSDTSPTVVVQQRERIGQLTPADRLARALGLSALARELAWTGARRVANASGPAAVRHRFLVQSYGAEIASWVARRIAAESTK
jgi:hypothetical protein